MALGPLITLGFLLLHSLGFAAALIRVQGEVTKHSTLAGPIQKTAAVFVIAKRKNTKMPLAVQRIADPKFPLKFDLGPEHIMVPGQNLDGEVYLEAKLTQRGDAISKPGDWIMARSPLQLMLGKESKKISLMLEKLQ